MDTDKKRWIILIAACLINLCLGSIYAWSVFASSMTDYFNSHLNLNVTAGDLAIVYTVANAVGPITMISGGWFNDRLGPKKVIAIGGIMFGGGMILSGFAQHHKHKEKSKGICPQVPFFMLKYRQGCI